MTARVLLEFTLSDTLIAARTGGVTDIATTHTNKADKCACPRGEFEFWCEFPSVRLIRAIVPSSVRALLSTHTMCIDLQSLTVRANTSPKPVDCQYVTIEIISG